MIEISAQIEDLKSTEALNVRLLLVSDLKNEVWHIALDRRTGKGQAYIINSQFGKPVRKKKIEALSEHRLLPGWEKEV